MFEGISSLPYNSNTGKPGNGTQNREFVLKNNKQDHISRLISEILINIEAPLSPATEDRGQVVTRSII